MKFTNWKVYAAGIAAFLIGFCAGAPFFGMLIHENSHAIACLLFGLAYSWSLTQVVYKGSPSPLVNTLVGLAGGVGQALFSLIFFWCAVRLEKTIPGESQLKRTIFFGFELAFLTIAFQGIINAIWEGLFLESYQQTHGDILLWGAITVACVIGSFSILCRRQKEVAVEP